MSNYLTDSQSRDIQINRPGNMMLDPLTDVGIRMFMAIRIGSGQFMVNVLGHGKRSQPQDETDHPQGHSESEQRGEITESSYTHNRRIGIQ